MCPEAQRGSAGWCTVPCLSFLSSSGTKRSINQFVRLAGFRGNLPRFGRGGGGKGGICALGQLPPVYQENQKSFLFEKVCNSAGLFSGCLLYLYVLEILLCLEGGLGEGDIGLYS
jgi:hypothetical protein